MTDWQHNTTVHNYFIIRAGMVVGKVTGTLELAREIQQNIINEHPQKKHAVLTRVIPEYQFTLPFEGDE